MNLILDSDSLCYRAGFVCNGEGDEGLACWQLEQLVEDIIKETNPTTVEVILSGSGNFRYDIYSEYKGNRKDMQRPIHLQAMREFLVRKYNALVTDGIEADDYCGWRAYSGDPVIISHLDKDLNMLKGTHYNYTKKEWYEVNELDAMRHFFYQLIMGDRADNIPGFDGLMRQKVPKFLQERVNLIYKSSDVDEMLEHVAEMYGDWDRFNLSAQCLWMQRGPYDKWTEWQNRNLVEKLKNQLTTTDFGQPADLIPLSEAPFVEPQDGGLPSSNV